MRAIVAATNREGGWLGRYGRGGITCTTKRERRTKDTKTPELSHMGLETRPPRQLN